jgi:acetyl esterase/lipase
MSIVPGSRRGRRYLRPGTILALSAVIAGTLLATLTPGPTIAASCPNMANIRVRGAEQQKAACLDDLTTTALTATGHTVPGDWAGLHAAGTINPSGVPGIQIDGYFPDTSTTNTNNGWNHDAQFVIRLPQRWNGKLVITGAPGVRRQYANDFIISDWVLDRGYAFASTDKGNTGADFYRDGSRPGDAVAEWHRRVRELTLAAQDVVRQRYGHRPERTYVTGISNGGYLARYAIENDHHLYDGAVDWEGTLFRAEGPNLFTYLPTALKYYPVYADPTRTPAERQAAHDAMIRAGFEEGSEFLWDLHYRVYWDLTQRIYREEFDPEYDGALQAGNPFCRSGTPNCDADYVYAGRPPAVKRAVREVSLTGRIGRPTITLHGTLDTLLPIRTDSDVYARLVAEAGRADRHRYYVVEAGNHVDSFYTLFPAQLRPILPCYRAAFLQLEQWVERGDDHEDGDEDDRGRAGDRQRDRGGHDDDDDGTRRIFVPKPAAGDVVNTCSLPRQ